MRLGSPTAFRAVREAGQRSRAGALIVLALGLWLIMAFVVGAFLYAERKEALRRAEHSAEALVLALEAHTARTYQAVAITLAGVGDALRLAPALQKNDPAFQEALRERLQALQPYARAIVVLDADGRAVHDTSHPHMPEISAFDRSFFQAHRQDPLLESGIWPPLQSRRSGLGWFLAVTHRLAEAGEFRGVVMAALEPQYFSALFGQLGLGTAEVISLYHRDGTLVARYPHQETLIGKPFADPAMFAERLPRAPSGTYVTDSGPFERLVSYRALEGKPLVIAMAQATEQILRSWRETALGAALGLGALALLLAALVAQVLRQERVRDLARERSVQSEKLEALGHLTGSVSHDFANLLNVMSASLRIIAAEPANARRVREAAAVGERALLRGSRLVEQLRTFARRQPMHVHPADLNLLIVAGMELLRQATGQGLRLQTELAAHLPRCLLDESELEVALVNLLVNAKDAGARGVVLKTRSTGNFVCLSIVDDGLGMSAEARRRVFEPYFTTKGEQGTGLGLAQVYGFMRQIGGDVHIESRQGKGTTVTLTFPMAPAAAHARAASAQ